MSESMTPATGANAVKIGIVIVYQTLTNLFAFMQNNNTTPSFLMNFSLVRSEWSYGVQPIFLIVLQDRPFFFFLLRSLQIQLKLPFSQQILLHRLVLN